MKSSLPKNVNKLIIAHSKITSRRNKFELLISQINDNIDVLMIFETKLDEGLPNNSL